MMAPAKVSKRESWLPTWASRALTRPSTSPLEGEIWLLLDEQEVLDRAEPAQNRSPEPSPKEEPAEPVAAEPAPSTQDKPRRESEGEARKPADKKGRPAWVVMQPVVVTALKWVNFPLRWVPGTARPVLDWVALSLVFWSLIVWVIVLVFAGH